MTTKPTKHTRPIHFLRYIVVLLIGTISKHLASRLLSETTILDVLLRFLRRLRRPATWPKRLVNWVEGRIENRKHSSEAIQALKEMQRAIDLIIEPYWTDGRINTLRRIVLKIEELRIELQHTRNRNVALKSQLETSQTERYHLSEHTKRTDMLLAAIDDIVAPFWTSKDFSGVETGMAVEGTIKELSWMVQALRYTLRQLYQHYEMQSCQCMEAPCVHTLANYVLRFTDITDLDEARSDVQSSDLHVDVFEDKNGHLIGYNEPDWISVEEIGNGELRARYIGADDALATVWLATDDAGAIVTATAPAWVMVEFHTIAVLSQKFRVSKAGVCCFESLDERYLSYLSAESARLCRNPQNCV